MAMVLRAMGHEGEQLGNEVLDLLCANIRSHSAHPAWVAERERRRAHAVALLRQRRDADTVNRVWAQLESL